MIAATQDTIVSHTAATERVSRKAGQVSLVIGGFALLATTIALLLTIRSIYHPLRKLIEGTRAVAKGQFSFRMDASTRDEIAELSHAFDQMVDDLAQLDAMKSNFISHVSHELKTPLVAMVETNRLLLDEIPGPLTAKQKRLLELNLDGGERLTAMILDLLEISQLQAGMRYHWKQQDLVPLAKRAVEEYEARARGKGIAIRYVGIAPSLTIWCDADRIAQVLHNLLDNALKHTEEGGMVVIGLREADRSVQQGDSSFAILTVTDTGTGIPDKEKELVFTKFYRADSNRGSGAGVGLGLAICSEIVSAHSGKIFIQDNPEGGTIVCVQVPYAPTADTLPVLSQGDSSEDSSVELRS